VRRRGEKRAAGWFGPREEMGRWGNEEGVEPEAGRRGGPAVGSRPAS
jgi:hypothetical protein